MQSKIIKKFMQSLIKKSVYYFLNLTITHMSNLKKTWYYLNGTFIRDIGKLEKILYNLK